MLILAAVDRSERDRLVMDQVRRLASQLGAETTLLHVVSLPKSLVPGALREAEAYLEAIRSGLVDDGINATTVIIKGDVADEICRTAAARDADVVVLGTRGRTGWDRLALGSVAEAVLEHCTRPVLVVNESAIRVREDDDVRRCSAYIASVVWAKQARGEITPEQAQMNLVSLEEQGLSRSVMQASYNELAQAGIPPDWLDIRFEIETLARYLPSEVAWLQLPGADGEAAAA